jgi:hypothetical protein
MANPQLLFQAAQLPRGFLLQHDASQLIRHRARQEAIDRGPAAFREVRGEGGSRGKNRWGDTW